MPEWSKFTDNEVESIKHKLNHKFERSMIITILLSPIICLVMPYFLGRRGAVINKMPYWDAVVQMSIIWFAALLGIWIWNSFKTKKQYSKNRKFLRKKNEIAEITDKSKSFLSSFVNIIGTNLEGDLSSIKIEKEHSKMLGIGDKVNIEFEEHTKTIFRIEKY